jgi:predicted lysophospholipase L1 biosynthesis ABC-type transport system permease subunit
MTVLPLLATSNTGTESGMPVLSPGVDTRPAEVIGEFPVLPVVSAGGTLADLRRALTGALPTVPDADVLVLARADTPAGVLDALHAHGAGEPIPATTIGAQVGARADAAQVKVGLVVAIAGLLVGVLALAAPITRMRSDRAHEEAVLRLLGVPTTVRSAATRVELALLSGVAAFMVIACGVVGVTGFLSNARLLDLPANQPPVVAGIGSTTVALVLLATAAAACVAVFAVGWVTRRTDYTRTDPALLRDGVA